MVRGFFGGVSGTWSGVSVLGSGFTASCRSARSPIACITAAISPGSSSGTTSVETAAQVPAGPPDPTPQAREIRIGSKKFTESVVLGEMLVQLARSAGSQAEHRAQLGGTRILFNALATGEIDAYPEYTGTITQEILGDRRLRTDEEIRAALSEYGIRMSRPR